MPLVFVTGPVRSGKSAFAERLAREHGGDVLYVATGVVDDGDAEWSARVAHHVARRPRSWATVETARAGSASLEEIVRDAAAERTLLVDSFGTWVGSLMSPGVVMGDLERRVCCGVDALCAARAFTIVVGEEVGWGLVPEYLAGRLFRDVVGRAQQRLAAEAVAAYLVVAGVAIDLGRVGMPVRARQKRADT